MSLCGGCESHLRAAGNTVHSAPPERASATFQPVAKASSKTTSEKVGATTTLLCPQLSAAECEYVGIYHYDAVDSAIEVAILDDHTFCMGVMAGSADLQAAGYWELNDGPEGGIRFREVHSVRDALWVRAREDGIADHQPKVVFELGASLQYEVAFGTSAELEPPKVLRPVFGDMDTWHYYYSTPPIERSRAKYATIGVRELPTKEHRARVRVNVYEVGEANDFRVDFDRQYGRHLMFPLAELQNGVLYTGQQRFGEKRALKSAMIENVRRYCIQPELQPDLVPGFWGRVPLRQASESEVWITVFPVKTFYVESDVIQGQPWFVDKERDRNREPQRRRESSKRR